MLAEYGEIMIPGFKVPAKWSYISALYEYQHKQGFKILGNRITKKHINFGRHKMKVSLAAQTLSGSVADALDHLRMDLKVQHFAGSEATSYFCRMFDSAFDALNSRTHLAKGGKAAITKENFMTIKKKLLKFKKWLHKLTVGDKALEKTRRKTCLIGFTSTIVSTISLSRELLFRKDDSFLVFHDQKYATGFSRKNLWSTKEKGRAQR